MNYRSSQLLAPTDLGPSGTKTIDINLKQVISQLEIRFKTTKVLKYMTAPGPANISKVEIVDGSRPLYSASGYEIQALGYYSRPGMLFEHGQHLNGSSEVDLYHLMFGRHLWDPELAFDPKKFDNPQLKITWDEDVADTSNTTNECEVLARIFDEKPVSPMGFLSAIESKAYTPGATGSYEETKLSEDYPIRQILVRAHYDGYEPWYNLAEARFDENGLQRIPFEYTSLEDYYRMMKGHWPKITTPLQHFATSGGHVFYVPQSEYWVNYQGQQQSGVVVPYISAGAARGGKLTIVSASEIQCDGLVTGYLPWSTFQFPMGLPNDIADWYNPKGKSPNLRLRAYTGATSADVQILLEQLHSY